MATPMTAHQLIFQLRKWHIPHAGYKNWQTHNRNHKGKWGGVNGFMWHHTGSDSTDQRVLLHEGYTALPGPLCHFGIAQNGTVWLIGWGRTNHAGLGDDDVLDAVIEERDAPVDNEANTDGNTHFYGGEFWHSGNKPMPDAQYWSGIKLSCAINDFHDWDENSEIAHGEWQPGKWDPGYAPGKMMNMDNVRRDIAAAMKRGPDPVSNKVPGRDIPAARSATYNEVWKTDAMAKPYTATENENKYYEAETMLRYAAEQAAEANALLKKIAKQMGIES